jgi:hypothetical protein
MEVVGVKVRVHGGMGWIGGESVIINKRIIEYNAWEQVPGTKHFHTHLTYNNLRNHENLNDNMMQFGLEISGIPLLLLSIGKILKENCVFFP